MPGRGWSFGCAGSLCRDVELCLRIAWMERRDFWDIVMRVGWRDGMLVERLEDRCTCRFENFWRLIRTCTRIITARLNICKF